MKEEFFRVACAAPAVKVGDPAFNAASVGRLAREAHARQADLVVFPELCVTGYTCGELFHNRTLLEASDRALAALAALSADLPGTVMAVGAPIRKGSALYNCAVIIAEGKIRAYIPKTYLPNYNEFYDRRWFTPAPEVATDLDGIPLGASLICRTPHGAFSAEVCEDLWVTVPPSSRAALAGAEVIVNLSASNDLIGKYSYLRELVAQQSARCLCGYAYASAGFGESSTDLVFDSKLLICENGKILASNPRWQKDEQMTVADVDLGAIRRDRLHLGSFGECARREDTAWPQTVDIDLRPHDRADLLRAVDPLPFVPTDAKLAERCEEILNIQTAGLAQRLAAIRCRRLVVGISGGLDSTLALLVAVRAFDALGLPRKGIIGVTMPGFGTTGRTHSNSLHLMELLGVDVREIPIGEAVRIHFRDIGHDGTTPDITYENSQARERTQILMDLANKEGALVLGTGDLSELALGWATYNGDHMSMYAVNAGVPKTLVRHLVEFVASQSDAEEAEVLRDIAATPISPELIPANTDGTIAQKTEDLVGPYELHDFFLYHTLRYGSSPRKIYFLARRAFEGRFGDGEIKKWMREFFRRFFSQQFKRSCLPDGPKVGSVCLSPRGDWRMPSDASSAAWLAECENL